MKNKIPLKHSIKKSLALQEKAKQIIPGGTQLLSKRPDMFAPGVWPGYYSKAQGPFVWDLDGNKYLDMSISGIGANVLGYADPDVDRAVKNAINLGVSCSLNCPEEVELADLLCKIHPWAKKARFTRTGGEAIAVAVRIARAYSGRDRIAFCGYHGWHDWYIASNLGTKNALGEHLLPGLEPCGVPKGLTGTSVPFNYNCIDELHDIIKRYKNEIGAIVIEPIRNHHPQDGFLDKVRALANKNNAVLIVDEISSGFRINTGGAHLELDFEPDIAVFSKALGNGYPMAAIIGKSDVMEAAQKTFISSTNWTERTGPSAALATVKKHRNLNVGKHLMSLWDIIKNGWQDCADRHGLNIQVDGILPMGHFNFNYPNASMMKSLFVQIMLEHGFLASNLYYAMYAHSEKHCFDYLEAVGKAFKTIVQLNRYGKIETAMTGGPSTQGFTRLT